MTEDDIIRALLQKIDDGESVSISREQDIIDVTPRDEIDLFWRYKDIAGHSHRYKKSKDGFWDITNTKSERGYYEDGDPYYYPVCRFCGERIYGGRKAVNERRHIAGRTHYFINGSETTEKVARAVAEYCSRKKQEKK